MVVVLCEVCQQVRLTEFGLLAEVAKFLPNRRPIGGRGCVGVDAHLCSVRQRTPAVRDDHAVLHHRVPSLNPPRSTGLILARRAGQSHVAHFRGVYGLSRSISGWCLFSQATASQVVRNLRSRSHFTWRTAASTPP